MRTSDIIVQGLREGWFCGGSVIFAVLLVVIVSAVSNFKQSRQFQALANESSDIRVVDECSMTRESDRWLWLRACHFCWNEHCLGTRDEMGNREFLGTNTEVDDVIYIIAAAVTIVVVAIPEGLPLAVTLVVAIPEGLPLACKAINVETSKSEKKRSGVLMKRINEKAVHTHWKGAAEMILAICSHYYVKSRTIRVLEGEARKQIETVIKDVAAKSLRCIAFAHTKVAEADGQVQEKLEETGLTLLGLMGLKYPCRPGVRAAVESCRNAGLNVKMVTGDNVHTAGAAAIEFGILNPDVDLNNDDESSVLDKLLMVQSLKPKGHVVALNGDRTNDAPAPKAADQRWGRCVYNNIQKFLQFQVTVNVAALIINFAAAVSSGKVPLTAVRPL
ncbi:calcium-transporting ATPase 12 plasma membrane-type [Citrus sinensis]|uniref:Calcium-transporting ATPase 12 plasma membrane-type n=1 Tax=Citrus sinensis TaxID=2711 RepID=A0ACB8MD53_CITSI|nr:calcium-transporting ATPase 12 plasma membrane-type [Citrus sinensis]